jgi:hypothetical protein
VQDPRKHFETRTKMSSFVGLIFGLVFTAIGISVIVFVWSDDGFGGPPLFFRVFASLIAICFVAMGGAVAYGSARALAGGTAYTSSLPKSNQSSPAAADVPLGYTCPACGAPLAEEADVSPQGDVKCAHCGRWFNIHRT